MKILLMLEKRWTGQLLIKMRETYSCCQLYNDINRCNCSFAPPLIRDMPGSVLVFISRWYPGMLSTCLRDKTFAMESFVWKCFFQWTIVMFTSIIGRFQCRIVLTVSVVDVWRMNVLSLCATKNLLVDCGNSRGQHYPHNHPRLFDSEGTEMFIGDIVAFSTRGLFTSTTGVEYKISQTRNKVTSRDNLRQPISRARYNLFVHL